MITAIVFQNMLASLGTGLGVGILNFVKKRKKGEDFSSRKLMRTGVTALVLGVMASASGYELTAENYEAYLAANAGVITVTEHLFVTALRYLGMDNGRQ